MLIGPIGLSAQPDSVTENLIAEAYTSFAERDYEQSLRLTDTILTTYNENDLTNAPTYTDALVLKAGSLSRIPELRHQAEDMFKLVFNTLEQFPERAITKANAMHLYGTDALLSGTLKLALARYAKADALYRVQDKGFSFSFLANNLLNIGYIHYRLGDLEMADHYDQQALEQCRLQYGEQSSLTAIAYNNIGLVRQKQGHLQEAIAMFKSAFAIKENIYDSLHPEMATAYNNLAWALWRFGDFEQASVNYRAGHEIASKYPKSVMYSATCNNLGLVLNYEQRHEEALAYHKQALALEQELGVSEDEQAITLHNIGYMHLHLGRYEQARTYFLQAVNTGKSDDYRKAELHLGLGTLYLKVDSLEQAEQAFRNTIRINKVSFSKDHYITAEAYFQLNLVNIARQEYQKALENTRLGLLEIKYETEKDWDQVTSFLMLYQLLSQRADILIQLDAPRNNNVDLQKAALKDLQLAVTALERVRSAQVARKDQDQMSKRIKATCDLAIAVCDRLAQQSEKNYYQAIAINLAERSESYRQRVGLENVKLEGLNPELDSLLQAERNILERIEILDAICDQRQLEEGAPEQKECTQKRLEAQIRYARILDKFKTDWPRHFQKRQLAPVIREQEIQQLLKKY